MRRNTAYNMMAFTGVGGFLNSKYLYLLNIDSFMVIYSICPKSGWFINTEIA
jgi:hypothetical protein